MKNKIIILLTLTGILIGLLVALPVISQDKQYHSFADTISLLGISNVMNVLSNIPFVIIGIIGLVISMKETDSYLPKTAMICFFIAVVLTGFGSAYYHIEPNNTTLVWDRIPMTITFMSLLAMIVSLHINKRWGELLLFPLLVLGIISVVYWFITEQDGHGDLRPYIFVQFYPMIAIPLIAFLFPIKGVFVKILLPMIGFYIVAKCLEHMDDEIYSITNGLSGHTLKHVFSALAIMPVLNIQKIYKKEVII